MKLSLALILLASGTEAVDFVNNQFRTREQSTRKLSYKKEEEEAKETDAPTMKETGAPTMEPTAGPTMKPTMEPTKGPTMMPTAGPTMEPTAAPLMIPCGCEFLQFYYSFGEIDTNLVNTTVGATVMFNAYDPETDLSIGVIVQSDVNLPDGDSIAQSTFSTNKDSDGIYQDQIHFMNTASGAKIAITGGAGSYGCASGEVSFVTFLDEAETLLLTHLVICGGGCGNDVCEVVEEIEEEEMDMGKGKGAMMMEEEEMDMGKGKGVMEEEEEAEDDEDTGKGGKGKGGGMMGGQGKGGGMMGGKGKGDRLRI